jgi:6-pyruvoyltetrahydropterin/6-carboxytetrahydropterin synthase
MYIIRKKFHFSAAHRLNSPRLSEEENCALFGKCASQNFHGHNYTLEVAITGDLEPATGMVMNFDAMKGIIEGEIIDALDHKNLNMDVDFLKGIITTSENLARKIWERLKPRLRGVQLYEINLGETDDNVITYRGEE